MKTFNLISDQESRRARSSARIEHRAFNPVVVGSIPAGPAIPGLIDELRPSAYDGEPERALIA